MKKHNFSTTYKQKIKEKIARKINKEIKKCQSGDMKNTPLMEELDKTSDKFVKK
jgi:hypothetical protein